MYTRLDNAFWNRIQQNCPFYFVLYCIIFCTLDHQHDDSGVNYLTLTFEAMVTTHAPSKWNEPYLILATKITFPTRFSYCLQVVPVLSRHNFT